MAPRGLIVIFLFFFFFLLLCKGPAGGFVSKEGANEERKRARERDVFIYFFFFFVFRGRYTPKHILYIPGLNHIKEREEEKKKNKFLKKMFLCLRITTC